MQIPKAARKFARTLFIESFTDGRLDATKVRKIVSIVAKHKPRHTLAVLKSYQRLVRLELARHHARIESATALADTEKTKLLAELQTRFGTELTYSITLNPALLGGLRIQVGDTVWDASIQGRLQRLQEALN